MLKLLTISFVFLLGAALLPPGTAWSNTGRIVQLDIATPIGPATSDYILRALEKTAAEGGQLILLRMDTPGGLDSAMRDIIKAIINSPIPVVTYVAPSGARAASAGTYILYASHIAAMAPATNLGAATPVQIGGSPGKTPLPPSPKTSKDNEEEDKTPAKPTKGDAMSHKIINDAVAYIRGLAQLRGRNAEWAEQAVREAASLPASEALKLKVIDIIAVDTADLLKQLNGWKVPIHGRTLTLQTTGMSVERQAPDWRSRLLAVITNPNVAYILMLIGIYGLIFEFSNPGAILPGTVGAICLLLALYAFQILPVNYAGLALVILGLILMVAEAFVPSFGALGIGGIIAFIIGSVILMDTDAPGFSISYALVIGFAASSALLFIFIIGMAIRARQRPVISGEEELLGGIAIALEDFSHQGTVRIHSENWQAESPCPVNKGQKLRVKELQGLLLHVTPLDSGNPEEH